MSRLLRTDRRDEGGFVAMSALAIILLLVATSLVLFSVAGSAISQSRQGRQFTEARQSLDLAYAHLLAEFNGDGGRFKNNPAAVVVGQASTATSERGHWKWTVTAAHTDPMRGVLGWDVEIASCVPKAPTASFNECVAEDGLRQSITKTFGYTRVSSATEDDKGRPVYQVSPLGAWRHGVASHGDSNLDGSILTGEYAVYGDGQVSLSATAPVPTAVSFGEGARWLLADGTSAEVRRSGFTATLDRTVLDAKVDACQTQGWTGGAWDNSVPAQAPYAGAPHNGQFTNGTVPGDGPHRPMVDGGCYTSLRVATGSAYVVGDGDPATPTEIVVRDAVRLGNWDLASTDGSQLHIYVAHDVEFWARPKQWTWKRRWASDCDADAQDATVCTDWDWQEFAEPAAGAASETRAEQVTAWIFAGGTCATRPSPAHLTYTGALACDRIDMTADFTYAAPVAPAAATDHVVYFEDRDGFAAPASP